MRGLRSTLLFILLSFSILIQNIEPVSATITGLATVGVSGVAIAAFFRKLKSPFYQTCYWFASLGYIYQVKIKNYESYATSDDIKSGKYVFLNLASKNFGSFITSTDQPPDTANKRSNMKLYEVKSHDFDMYQKKLTIGCVKYYVRTLQCHLKYEFRTVLTYQDERGKKCIQIESFNANGHRIMKRIFREREWYWWYNMIIDEKETILKSMASFNLFKESTATTYQLDLNSNILPVIITKAGFTHGHYFFMSRGKFKPSQLTEILFANEPQKPTEGSLDILIWHFFTKDQQGKAHTSLVSICENFKLGWTCKHYKCMSEENREFKSFDSMVSPLDDSLSFKRVSPKERQVENFDLRFDLKTKNVPDNLERFEIHIYPDSNHYTLRPQDLNNVYLATRLRTFDPGGNSLLYHDIEPCFRLVGIAKYGKIYLVSYTALNSTNLLFNTVDMKPEMHHAFEVFYESSSRPYLESMLSPYYMGLYVEDQTLTVKTLDLDLRKLDGILTAKLNNNVTLYSSLYSQFKVIKTLRIDSEYFEVDLNINTQIFYCETSSSKFIVISSVGREIAILKKKGNTYVAAALGNMQESLGAVNLSSLLSLEFQRKWAGVTLDLDDVYISREIEVLIISYNAVMFKTQYGTKITKVIWKELEITISKGWCLITKMMYMEHSLLLIDTLRGEKIHRELYKLDEENHKIVLMANKQIENTKDIDALADLLSESIYHLYPNNLPVKVYFDNPKTLISEFEIDEMQIAHSNCDLLLTPGDLSVHGTDYKVQKNHKWRQVFKYKGHGGSDFYNIFVMAERGMYSYYCNEDGKDREVFDREFFIKMGENTIPLLVDSVYLPGVKVETAKIGKKEITTYRSKETSKVLNPIIFGKHEIKLLGKIKSVEVCKSYDNRNLRLITIEATFEDKTKGNLIFTQNYKSLELYNCTEVKDLEYIDQSINFLDLVQDQSNQDVLDFNEGRYPLDVRYMVLNRFYYYFTGYTRFDKFSVKFGTETIEIFAPNTRYNIWIRYPYQSVTTSVMMISYVQDNKLRTVTVTHDNHGSDFKIERPDVNFNWGILSNVEALLVNRTLLNMATHREEFFPIDLNLDETPNGVIMKLKVDDNTSVYTTLSNCNCIINNVIYKNAVIKGVSKQLAKQVFLSKINGESVLVIATKTISRALLNAYLLKENTFETIDISKVDCRIHRGLKSFQMCE